MRVHVLDKIKVILVWYISIKDELFDYLDNFKMIVTTARSLNAANLVDLHKL